MEAEIKSAIQNLGETFEQFKQTYDEKLEQVAKSEADPILDEKLAKIEAKMDSLEDVNQAMTKQQAAQENLKEQMEQIHTVVTRPNSGFDSKQVDGTLKAFDQYCRKGIEGLEPDEKKALTVSNDSTGGFLAPPEYVRELIKTITEISPVRSIARIRQTAQRSIQVPKRTGQFAAAWVAESGTRSETTGYTVGLEEIPAHEYYALIDISEQDLEDTVFDLEAEMQAEFAERFALLEGTAFVSGDSVGKPEGFMTNSSVSEVVSGNSSALLADGLISLVHSIN